MSAVPRDYKSMAIPLDRIILDPECQPRVSIDVALVEEYADKLQTGAIFDAIDVYYDGRDHYCADGFHRVQAYRAAKRESIAANVYNGGKREAILHAVGSNTTHGLRRSNSDKRRAVEMLLRDEQWSKWSDRQIADQCGVSGPFVGDVRRAMTPAQVQTVSTCDEPKTRTGRDGKQYPASQPRPKLAIISDEKPKKKDAFELAGDKVDARITPEVIIPEELTDVAGIIEEHEEQDAREEDASDERWLNELPLSEVLKGTPLKHFHASALLWRDLAAARRSFAAHASKAIKKHGRFADSYAFTVKRFLKIDHPKTWVRCPAPEHGGCGGSGQIPLIGQCQKCHANGFWFQGGTK